MTTMRNYRQIMKTDASGVALGGSNCRAVRDRIKFRLNIVRLTLHDVLASIPDGITFIYPPEPHLFSISDQVNVGDTIKLTIPEEPEHFSVQDSLAINDDIVFQEE